MPEISSQNEAPALSQGRVFGWLKGHQRGLLVLACLLQLAVLVGMILLRMVLLTTGETLLLRVVPVDPRDIFRGDYVILNYNFTRVFDKEIVGLGKVSYDNRREWAGRTVYVELLPEPDGKHWQGGDIHLAPPDHGKYIRGTISEYEDIQCGIDAYYVQEGEGMKYDQAARDRKLSAEIALASDGQAGLRALHIDDEAAPATVATGAESKKPPRSWPSDTTYRVRYLPDANLEINGKADNPLWAKANVEKQFFFPWKKNTPAPLTEFRALCDEKYLYFAYQVEDADLVVLDTLRDKEDVIFEDRCELFFSRDPEMNDYYCFEIDPRGRTYDYQMKFYREANPKWSCPGLETKGTITDNGYIIEGRIPLESFENLGFPKLRPGKKILCGLYRAEFSHDRSGKPVVQEESVHNHGRKLDGPPPIMEWISWVDPKTPDPDFHVPSSLGWLEIVR
jgi:uncharacterized membrane-anchored protein